MRLHYLQHVSYETPGSILEWAAQRGFTVTGTRLDVEEALPSAEEFDWLVVMGGPMNVYEDEAYPWLPAEKALIDAAVVGGKVVLGICLGAQLLADVLGARVTRNATQEIGWYPVTLTAPASGSPAFAGLPEEFDALHWHGDTFELPPGAERVAESAACVNQAFAWGKLVFGVQFHLECSQPELEALVAHSGSELVDGPWIQPAAEILGRPADVARSRELMWSVLDGIARAAAE